MLTTETIDIRSISQAANSSSQDEVLMVSSCKAVQRALKHLCVMVDDRSKFNSYVDYACEKAAIVPNAVSRIMPNTPGGCILFEV